MHPLRALWEWYIIVHWTPLIKNQDVNVPPAILESFKMAAMKKTKCLYSIISASYNLLCLRFRADHLCLRYSTPVRL